MLRRSYASKTYLKVLLGVGVLAVIGGGAGTFASFTAETTNANNTFATGTLLLDNNGGTTTCHSAADTTNNATTSGCDILFNLDPLPSAASTQWAQLTLSNVGSLDAGGIDFWASNACATQASNPSGPTFGGGGNLCNALQVVIVETDSSFHHSVSNPALGCAYGQADATGLGCSFNSAFNLAGLPGSASTLTVAAGQSGNTGTQLTHAQSRYFAIGVSTPAAGGLNNTFQNRKAAFDLTWRITQA
jgi:predicted ribosomally synthesized peptide with SipW-like signal peptide